MGLMSQLREVIGEQKPEYCVQCGKCTSVCPVSRFMDFNPRKIIAMIDLNMIDDLLKSRTIWTCTDCLKCVEVCPRTVSPYDAIQALRNIAVEKGLPYPSGYDELMKSVIGIGFIQQPQTIRTRTKERINRQSLELPTLQTPLQIEKIRSIVQQMLSGKGENP